MKILNKITTILILSSSALTAVQGSQIIPLGNPVWINPFEFQVTYRNNGTNEIFNNVIFKCQDKVPHSYLLFNADNFPRLDLSKPASCQSFHQMVQDYVAQLKVMRRQYTYGADISNNRLTCKKMPPNQIPLPCILDTLCLQANYELGRLELSLLLVKIGQENDAVILDITLKLRERFGIVPLVKLKTEAQSNFSRIVSTRKNLNDAVFDAVGSILYYQKPHLPHISDFEGPASEIKVITYMKGSNPYEDALASRILRPQSDEWTFEITDNQIDDDGGCFSETESFSGMSMSNYAVTSDSEDDGSFELYQHFKLIDHERQSISPYIYNDGNGFFLTETFEQDCFPLIKGEADSTAAHTLRYTLATLYPVQVNGLSTSNPKGLYQLEGDSWMRVNDFYEAQDLYLAQRMMNHGILKNTVMSQPQTCGLKCTLENLGGVADYVELMGSARFQQLLSQFQGNTTGLLRTVAALRPEEQHLIVPLLLILRELPHLRDDDLIHKGSFDTGDKKSSSSAWKYFLGQEHYKNLHHFLKFEWIYYVLTPSSLKLLPLISVSDAWWNMTGQLQINAGEYNCQTRKAIPFGFGTEVYQSVAQFLELDQLIKFNFLLHYEHESDTELTIQSMARAIRHLKNLKTFHIPRYIGIKNLEYLIDRGLCQNSSITNLIFGGICGDYAAALMGRVLAKNTTIKILEMYMENIADLECLNKLGRGLEKNKTVTELRFQISTDNNNPYYDKIRPDWVLTQGAFTVNDTPQRPLPGRPRGSRTHDFSVFREALMLSNVTNITIGMYEANKGRNPYVDSFVNMIKEINKPGLVKHIY